MPKAVIHTATGAVLRYGYCDFSTDGTFDPATQTQVDVTEGSVPLANIPLYYNKIVGGLFVEMSAAQKAAVDAARAAEKTAALDGAVRVERVVNSLAALPIPPPAAGLLVGVITAGQMGLAISGTDRWFLFAVDGVVGP